MNTRTVVAIFVGMIALTSTGVAHGQDRGKRWYGEIAKRPGDEKFHRIYVEDATLYHDDGSEVALWGVNFQSAMSWEWSRSQRGKGPNRQFDSNHWKAIVDRGFDEIQLMGCDVIRIHLCPGDLADARGNLVENEWLDMLDYTMAECHRRGIYINFALLNHLGGWGKLDAILNYRLKEHKWEAVAVPEKIKASENYIRQLANRRNPYDNDRRYKHSPAWIIAEIMNEPVWPKNRPSRDEFPDGVRIYEKWLAESGKQDGPHAWSEFKYESIKAYINRIDRLLYDERVPAVPCWNLLWSKGPIHQGWETYDAAADSSIPAVSFSTYPGQSDSFKGADLSDRNYLPYLEKSYGNRQWQGWLREERFKGRKAPIVYEYETWHNQSTYMYPAMAKYFRAQGEQIATMWTYYLHEEGNYLGRTHAHNLNLVSTPRKAAGFMVAKQVFENTPRYQPYETTKDDADRFGNAALSFPLDLSAYADENVFIHTGDVNGEFVELPPIPKRIVGYGSSPFIQYSGKGLYFLEAVFGNGRVCGRWTLKVMPHAVFKEDLNGNIEDSPGGVAVSSKEAFPMTIDIPRMERTDWEVYRLEKNRRIRVETRNPGITFDVRPGKYEILHK